MTHQMTLVESTKDDVYKRLNNPPTERFGHHTSPRWLGRQIKFLLSTLHRDVMYRVLNLVHITLRATDKKPLWAALFASMVVLAMMTETQEHTLRCKEKTDKGEGAKRQDDRTADDDIKLMDEMFDFLHRLFHQKYGTFFHKAFNPLRSSQDRASLDEASQSLAAKASVIVENHCESYCKMLLSCAVVLNHETDDFLVARQALQAPSIPDDPQAGRLVARFLLCLWPPAKQNPSQLIAPAGSKHTTDHSKHNVL